MQKDVFPANTCMMHVNIDHRLTYDFIMCNAEISKSQKQNLTKLLTPINRDVLVCRSLPYQGYFFI